MKKDIILTKLSLKGLLKTLFLIFFLQKSNQMQAQIYLGQEYTYINKPLLNDKKTNSIQLNSKISSSNDNNWKYGFSDYRIKEIGISVVKRYKKMYFSARAFNYSAHTSNYGIGIGIATVLSNSSIGLYKSKIKLEGHGFRFGAGKYFEINESDELNIGLYANTIFEKQRFTVNKVFGETIEEKIIDKSKYSNIGSSIEYRRKIDYGNLGLATSFDVTPIRNVYYAKANATAFVTYKGFNFFTNVTYDPKFSKKITMTSVGLSYNLNYKITKKQFIDFLNS